MGEQGSRQLNGHDMHAWQFTMAMRIISFAATLFEVGYFPENSCEIVKINSLKYNPAVLCVTIWASFDKDSTSMIALSSQSLHLFDFFCNKNPLFYLREINIFETIVRQRRARRSQ